MLITEKWSEPAPLSAGKPLCIRSSRGHYVVKLFNNVGHHLEWPVDEELKYLEIPAEKMDNIPEPLVCFRSLHRAELHLDWHQD